MTKKPSPCDECDAVLNRPSDLKRHKQAKHVKQEDKAHLLYYCTYPGCPRTKGFEQKTNYDTHLATHTRQVKKCPQCDYTNTDPSAISKHRKNEHGSHARSSRRASCTASSEVHPSGASRRSRGKQRHVPYDSDASSSRRRRLERADAVCESGPFPAASASASPPGLMDDYGSASEGAASLAATPPSSAGFDHVAFFPPSISSAKDSYCRSWEELLIDPVPGWQKQPTQFVEPYYPYPTIDTPSGPAPALVPDFHLSPTMTLAPASPHAPPLAFSPLPAPAYDCRMPVAPPAETLRPMFDWSTTAAPHYADTMAPLPDPFMQPLEFEALWNQVAQWCIANPGARLPPLPSPPVAAL